MNFITHYFIINLIFQLLLFLIKAVMSYDNSNNINVCASVCPNNKGVK